MASGPMARSSYKAGEYYIKSMIEVDRAASSSSSHSVRKDQLHLTSFAPLLSLSYISLAEYFLLKVHMHDSVGSFKNFSANTKSIP